MRRHPRAGASVIRPLGLPRIVLDIVLYHHERWDGTGYPQGLTRAKITGPARILAVADALDSMTADRPYPAAPPVREAIQDLVASSGMQFDPAAVQALVALVARRGEGWVAAPPRKQPLPIELWRGRVERR